MFQTRIATLTGLILALGALSSGAQAQFVSIAQPDSAYVNSTTKLQSGAADFTPLASLSDSALSAAFSSDVVALSVPDVWTTWGAPPDTESATPQVFWTQGATALDIDFPSPVGIFGLEAQPNTLTLSPITATFFHGATTVGTITLDVDGSGGASLFAARLDGNAASLTPFTRISLTSSDDFAIAQLRFGAVVPEPGTLALLGSMGLSGGAMFYRRRRAARC